MKFERNELNPYLSGGRGHKKVRNAAPKSTRNLNIILIKFYEDEEISIPPPQSSNAFFSNIPQFNELVQSINF